MSIKRLREMRIKDVGFVNCDFALFISINFIIVNRYTVLIRFSINFAYQMSFRAF